MAKMWVKQGEREKAEELCRQARTLLPEMQLYQAWVNRLLGRIAIERKQQVEALKRFQQAADCYMMLGEVTSDGEGTYTYANVLLYQPSTSI